MKSKRSTFWVLRADVSKEMQAFVGSLCAHLLKVAERLLGLKPWQLLVPSELPETVQTAGLVPVSFYAGQGRSGPDWYG